MLKKKTFFALAFLFLFLNAIASNYNYDPLENAFHTRAYGMGGAMTALAFSAGSSAYNVAGLGFAKRARLDIMSSSAFDGDLNTVAFNFVYPFNDLLLGFDYLNQSVSDILITGQDLNQQPIIFGTKESSTSVFNFALAKEIIEEQTVIGLNLKYISYDLISVNASALGIDFGVIQKLGYGIKAGLAFKNLFNTNINWSNNNSDYIPFKLVGGLAYETEIFDRALFLSLDADLLVENIDPLYAIGLEYFLWQDSDFGFSLRLGQNRLENITLGLGFYYQSFLLDYAYANHELGSTNQISLGYQF